MNIGCLNIPNFILEILSRIKSKLFIPFCDRYKFNNEIGFRIDKDDVPLCPKCLSAKIKNGGIYKGNRLLECPIHGLVTGAMAITKKADGINDSTKNIVYDEKFLSDLARKYTGSIILIELYNGQYWWSKLYERRHEEYEFISQYASLHTDNLITNKDGVVKDTQITDLGRKVAYIINHYGELPPQ